MSDTGEAGQAARPPPKPLVDEGLDPASAIALALSAVWVLAAAVAFLFLPRGAEAGWSGPGWSGPGWSGLGWAVALVAVVMPLALIWLAALMARAARTLREESARLRAAVDVIRATAATQVQGGRAPMEAKLDEIARAQRQAEAALARLAQQGGAVGGGTLAGTQPRAQRAAPVRPANAASGAAGAGAAKTGEAAQPRLALGTPDEAEIEPIPNAEFVRALNFPEDERDAEGFRALRLALKDPFSAGLIRSSQDVLTLLAEDGIYMDDLAPDLARPEVWRRFAQGERGKGIAALGGIRDRSCLALTSGRMRQDPVFRDVAHHFLRKFDRTVADFEPRASDSDIVALSDTRTARAFMLLGRVSGTFD